MLGAIVSPTDPVAATAIARRLGVPGRIVTIVEGESLVNDATALVAYKFAVAAVVTGSFSLLEASGEFVLVVVGGIAVGIAVGADHRRGPQAARQPAGRGHDRALLRLLRLPAGGGDRGLRRARRGHRRHLHGPADLAPDHPDHADPGRRRLGDRHLPAQLGAVRARRAAAADRGRRDRRARDGGAGPRRRAGRRDRDRHPDRLGVPVHLPAAAAVSPPAQRRPLSAVAAHPDRRLDGDARRGLARGGAGAAADDRRRRRLPRPRADHLLRLLGDPRDAADPGPDPAAADQVARGRRLRRGARARGDLGAAAGDRGGDRAHRRADRGGVGARRHRRADARRLHATASGGSPRSRRRASSTAASTATGSTTRPARSPTSGWCARCSTPSARP